MIEDVAKASLQMAKARSFRTIRPGGTRGKECLNSLSPLVYDAFFRHYRDHEIAFDDLRAETLKKINEQMTNVLELNEFSLDTDSGW